MLDERVFEVRARRRIYNCVTRNPGLHFREISREVSIPKTTLGYHLKYLSSRGFLLVEQENGYRRYYASEKIGENDKKLLSILRQTVPRNIILYLSMCPNTSQTEIVKFAKKWKNHPSKIGYHLNKHHTTLNFHIQKLIEMDFIESFRVGHEIKYKLAYPEDLYDILIRYDKSLLADACGHFFKWFENPKPDYVERVMVKVYEIFPHPYLG